MAGMPERKVVGGYLPAGMVPSGELSAYTPTARERTVDALRRALYSDDRAGQDKAERLMSVPDAYGLTLPLDAYDVARTAAEGNPVGAGMMAAGMILPGNTSRMSFLRTPVEPNIMAYHSSPHWFDKFRWDASTRGIGEGAQMISDGVYLAQSPEVSGKFGSYYNKFLAQMQAAHKNRRNPFAYAQGMLDDPAIGREGAIDILAQKVDQFKSAPGGPISDAALQSYLMQLEYLKSGKPLPQWPEPFTGEPTTYEVGIKARPDELLNWDEAMRYQPKQMQDAMQSIVNETKAGVWPDGVNVYDRLPFGDFTGAEVARSIQKMVGKPRAADMMLDRGIPGVKYLDGNSRAQSYTAQIPEPATGNMLTLRMPSRGHIVDHLEKRLGFSRDAAEAIPVSRAPEATDNYVIRDVDRLNILKRYAMPGLLGAGMIKAATDQNRETQ